MYLFFHADDEIVWNELLKINYYQTNYKRRKRKIRSKHTNRLAGDYLPCRSMSIINGIDFKHYLYNTDTLKLCMAIVFVINY